MKVIKYVFCIFIFLYTPMYAIAQNMTMLRGESFYLSGSVDLSGIDSSFGVIPEGSGNGFYVLFQFKPMIRLGGGKLTVLNSSSDSYFNFDGGGFMIEFNYGDSIDISGGALLGAGNAVILKKMTDTSTPGVEEGRFHRSRIYFIVPQISIGFPVISKKVVPYLIIKRIQFLSGGEYVNYFSSNYYGLQFSWYF